MKPPTIKDLAAAAGVSVTTVSYALRNDPCVRPDTRDRILALAERLGYRRDSRISTLMSRIRSGGEVREQEVLAWINVFPDHDHFQRTPWLRDFWLGAEARARELGFRLQSFQVNHAGVSPRRLADILYARGISGVIIPAMRGGRPELDWDWSRFACVCIERGVVEPPLHRVDVNAGVNFHECLRRTRELGYKRVGLTMAETVDKAYDRVFSAYWLRFQYELPARRRVPMQLAFVPSEEYVATFLEWFEKHEPDAVVCRDYRLLNALRSRGVRVPEDVGLIHERLSDDVKGWTGMDPRERAIGAAGVDMVVAQLNRSERGLPPISRELLLRGVWSEGFTTRRQ